jgi:hypothetical protein
MSQNQHIDFNTFILSVSSAAFMGLGLVPSPDGKKEKNLSLARHNIDLLELIKDKTKGNLTAEEQKLLDQVLYETRMRFIEAQK